MSSTVDGYWGMFPTVLFVCDDYEHPMHFILSLKKTGEQKINDLVKLMAYCGAEVSFNLNEASDYSAVIVDHNDLLDFFGPAFTLSYIEECLNRLQLQDISKFRQEATSHIAPGANCMRVVYFRRQGWSSLVTGGRDQTGCGRDENVNRLVSSTTQEENHQSDGELSDHVVLSDDNTEVSTQFNHSEKERIAHHRIKVTDHSSKTQDKYKEIASSTSNDNVIGALCPTNVKKGVKSGVGKWISKTKNVQNSVCGSASNKWSFLDDLESESESLEGNENQRKPEKGLVPLAAQEENHQSEVTNHSSKTQDKHKEIASSTLNDNVTGALCPTNIQKGVKSEVGKWISKTRNVKNSVCGSASNKWSFLDDLESEPESVEGNKNQRKLGKRSRHPYTIEERFSILKYIVRHHEYSRLKGRELWEIMERRKVCPSRTWQSMKEHFIKKILIDLEPYTFLTPEQKRKIKSSCF